MSAQTFDLAIIGGGINGAGIAADAAGRGLKVLLAEKGDLGGATSSAQLQADPRRPALPRALRVPARARGARRARGAAAQGAAHRLAAAFRAAARAGTAAAMDDPRRPRFSTTIWPRARRIPASRAHRSWQRSGGSRRCKPDSAAGFAYWDCWVDDARLVIAQRPRGGRPRRRYPDRAPRLARRASTGTSGACSCARQTARARCAPARSSMPRGRGSHAIAAGASTARRGRARRRPPGQGQPSRGAAHRRRR